ncbi:MAG: AEC family transporter [Chloroflexi bacterium]|nr:AEC family transporter [Chloroflexota bacterium]
MAVGNLLSSILAVVLLIAVGYFVKRVGLLRVDDRRVVNDIIVYLAMPALVFRSIASSKLNPSFLKFSALALVVMAVSMALAYFLGRLMKLERKTFGALLLVAVVGNTGYLGYPLTISLFGRSNLAQAVFFDIFGSVFFVFTVGVVVARRLGGSDERLNVARELFTFPPLIGLFAAGLLQGVSLPLFLDRAVEFLAGATVPLIMLSIGLSIELNHLLEHRRPLGATVLIKLVAAPLIALVAARIFGFTPVDTGISVLEASMPTMMISMVIGLKYGLDVEFMAAAIVGSTLLSTVTVPVWQYLAHLT